MSNAIGAQNSGAANGGNIAPETGISKTALLIAAAVAVVIAILYFRNRK